MAEKFVEISFDDKQIKKFLTNLGKRTKQFNKKDKVVADIMAAKVFEDVQNHFEKQSDPRGRWEAWSSSYTNFMKKIGRQGNKILQFSGRLRNTFKPGKYRTSQEGITWFNDAKTKSGYPYAWAHDTGQSRVPMREFMWLSNKAGVKIEKAILMYLRDGKK